jgi:DNA-directed RNA polymerase
VRETFIEQYTPDVLARLHAEVGAQLQANGAELPENFPSVPRPGSLDLAAVRESAYFFA